MADSLLLKVLMDYDRFNDLDNYYEWMVEDFEAWIWGLIKIKLYPYQIVVAKAVLHSLINGAMEEILAEFARQMGKTQLSAAIHGYCAAKFPDLAKEAGAYDENCAVYRRMKIFEDGFRSGIFAPTKKQSKEAYDRTHRVMLQLKLRDNLKMDMSTQSEFLLPNGSYVRLFTASPGADIKGASLHFIHIDEAQDVIDEKILESILPMGSHSWATTLLTGTPGTSLMRGDQPTRYFYEALHDPRREKERFIFDWHHGAKHDEGYKLDVTKKFERLGTENRYMRISYNLEWIKEALSFTNIEKIKYLEETSRERGIKKVKTLTRDDLNQLYENIYVGIDVAQMPDSTVVTIAQLNKREDGKPEIVILDWLEIEAGIDYVDQVPIIMEVLRRYSVRAISIDSTGQGTKKQGSALYQLLQRELTSNRCAEHMHTYLKPLVWTGYNHSDIFTKLHEMWNHDQILFPADESKEHQRFREQFELLGYKFDRNLLRCHHPKGDDMHDDYCNSLAIMLDSIGIDYLQPERPFESASSVRISYGPGIKSNIRGFHRPNTRFNFN